MSEPSRTTPAAYAAPTSQARVTVPGLHTMARDGVPIAMLTCYDASFAAVCERAGVDVLLIGDSLGNVIQGRSSTIPVTLDDVLYHTRCVAAGAQRALVITDLPIGTYQESREQAYRSCVAAMQAGAHMCKMEGGAWLAPTVEFVVARGIPVCGHVGLLPQFVHAYGGYRVQGKGEAAAAVLRADAHAISDAGAALIVVECVPRALVATLASEVKAPLIGIGAGPDCAGQVLVIYDVLGIQPGRAARFVRNFAKGAGSIEDAIAAYVRAVKQREFPAAEHCF
ncbi:MAG TPA: 3-methyl-2-oxobutanoate hydroxymethyltransferase [Casimicrobiaceae bacterium]|nr:3-methyl-2-oxobutanoate hydroxymethyltransferase [Casimicrobiaceae bacterium]